MTDKEVIYYQLIVVFIVGLLVGMFIGVAVIEARMNSEIRTDQLELKEQVAEIIEDDTIIKDIIDTLLFHVDQLKKERQELRELKILLGKGE